MTDDDAPPPTSRSVLDAESDRLAWRLAVDAAGVGAFVWDLVTGDLRFDERLHELFGLDEESFGGTIEAFSRCVHPDDIGRVSDALQSAIATCGDYAAEYRVVLPDGTLRWIEARGHAFADQPDGPPVRLVGAAYDTTQVREGEARMGRVLESMSSAFFQLDREWRFTYVNSEAERLLGATRVHLIGASIWDAFPAAVGSAFEENYRGAVASGEPVTFEAWYPPPLDAWYEVRAWPSPEGLAVYFVDITARRDAQEALDRSAHRLALLASVSEALTATLDPTEGVSRLATQLVPELADWCLVTLVEDPHAPDWRRGLRDVGWSHRDPAMEDVLREYAARRLRAMTDSSYLAQAIREMTAGADGVLRVRGGGGGAGARHGARPAAPPGTLLCDGRPAAGPRPHGRGGQRLPRHPPHPVHRRRRVPPRGHRRPRCARARQRPPLRVAARRLRGPAAQHAHRTAAAPRPPGRDPLHPRRRGGPHRRRLVRRLPAGQRRGPTPTSWSSSATSSATTWRRPPRWGRCAACCAASPCTAATRPPRSCPASTRSCSRCSSRPPPPRSWPASSRCGPASNGSAQVLLRWSHAGHPPALLVDHDGTVTRLADADANDLLLGFDPAAARHEGVVALQAGATLVLYTDGLVERRDRDIEDGIEALERLLAEMAPGTTDLDHLCDRLLGAMASEEQEDDVALLVVRWTPDAA